jgi:uncharacterized protein YbgA (DUF1722 family)/uncharacterized protein YbbK (DUF523 family)
MNDSESAPRPRLGISSCLLGNSVRYDGGHKNNAYVNKTLGQHFDFVPFCPEVAIGLPTPRPPIRLVARDNQTSHPRALRIADQSLDYTDQLREYATQVSPSVTSLSGYIVKKDSPSCGMERVKVYPDRPDTPPSKHGSGIYTQQLMREHPELPVEEEGRLMDPALRENFIVRVFTLFRWQQMRRSKLTSARLVQFHTRTKFLLLAHDEKTYRELGRMVADAGTGNIETLASVYIERLMAGMKTLSSPSKHANVLMHIMGFIKDRMTREDKQELLGLIEAHRTGLVPLIVPVTLLNHFLRTYPHEYIEQQYFLDPHPRELMLRNNI